MAGYIANGMAIDYHDGEGQAVVNGRLWRWEFHEYAGPQFLRKDGTPMKRYPGEKHAVWIAFEKWLKKYRRIRKKTPARNIVLC